MTGDQTVLVLWIDQFDELAATAFITMLRKIGVRVKLVGAAHHWLVGASGLALVPDVTLEQALLLAHSATAVIVPGNAGAIRRLGNDPRVQDLLNRAQANEAVLITGKSAIAELAALASGEYPHSTVESYPDEPASVEHIHQLVEGMSQRLFGSHSWLPRQ